MCYSLSLGFRSKIVIIIAPVNFPERALSGQAQRCRSSAAYAAAAAAAVAAAAAMRRGIHYVFSASVRKRSRGIFDSCPKGALKEMWLVVGSVLHNCSLKGKFVKQ